MAKNISPLNKEVLDNEPQLSLELLSEQERRKDFYGVPTSSATNTVLEVMSTGKDIPQLKTRKKLVNHGQEIEVLQSGNKRQITVSSNTSTVTLEISDIDKLVGSNKPAKKMFIYSLIKMNEQAYSGGVLRRNYIQFPLQELIDIGYYSCMRSARKGFNNAMDILTSLKVKGMLQLGKKKSIVQSAIEVLFTGANIKKGTCTIYLNERINWSFIAQFYTIIPRYAFKLPNRSFDLLFYIFYIARQRIKEISERGYFTIGMRAIQERLNLPNEHQTKNPDRDIKQAIDEAITEIEKHNESNDFTITPIYDLKAPIANYLSNGYLKIGLKGKYAQNFIAISQNKDKQIKTIPKSKNSAAEKSIATNAAKKETNKIKKEN